MQVSQEAGQVVWYSHLLKNFPQYVGIHTVKGFSVVNEAEVDVFLEFSCFLSDPTDVGNLISGSSAFSKTSYREYEKSDDEREGIIIEASSLSRWKEVGSSAQVEKLALHRIPEFAFVIGHSW